MRRTFRATEFVSPGNGDLKATRAAFLDRQRDFTWEGLLENPRVLLVAEAGAGKSHECRGRAEEMFKRGEAAFFLRLEHVSTNGVEGSLGKKALRRFKAWRASASQTGYFFLDSVDELQLVHLSFKEALERLADDIEGALGRAVIVVTSRPIAFDRSAFAKALPVPRRVTRAESGDQFVQTAMQEAKGSEEDPAPATVREFELLPLNNEQILELAQELHVKSPTELLREIEAKSAQDFVRWPQELIELCDDWREHGEIRAQRLQMESHVTARLTARQERREQADLSPATARQGAQRLAVAVMLCRRWAFRYGASADNHSTDEKPIDPSVILAGWNARQVSALLQRPLFGDGGYGQAQFRHRSVLEYLAACQIHDQIEQGTVTLSAAKRLLFGMSGTNETLLKQGMRPVAAWLSLMRPDIFEAVLSVEPATLLMHGDPESLEPAQCQRALTEYVARFGKGGWRGLEIARLQVVRLARQPLGATIATLWNTGIENPEVRRLLLQAILAGGYHECADLAADAATDDKASPAERYEAIAALSKLADARADEIIETSVSTTSTWPPLIGRLVCAQLYPAHVTDDQFLQVLEGISKDTSTDLPYASSVINRLAKADIPVNRLVGMLPRLASLALAQPHADVDDDGPKQTTEAKAAQALRVVCLRLLADGVKSTEVLRAAVIAFRTNGTPYERRHDNGEFFKLLSNLDTASREVVFRADYEWVGKRHTDFDSRKIFQQLAFHNGAVTLQLDRDRKWIYECLADPAKSLDYRAVLLNFAFRLAPRKEKYSKIVGIKEIRRSVKDSAELTTHLENLLETSKPDPMFLKMEQEHEKHQAQSRRKREKQRRLWHEFWEKLAKHPDDALAPKFRDTTIWNLYIALRNRPRGGDDLRWDRAFIGTHFGDRIADELKSSFKAYWRSMRPTVRAERTREEKSTFAVFWSIGLIGIYAEAEDERWAAKLTAKEAELATRYALLEVSGYPSWLDALADAHPTVVESVLGSEIDSELDETGTSGRWHSTNLQSLQYGSALTGRLLQGRLIGWLQKRMPLGSGPCSPEFESKIEQVTRVLLVHASESVKRWLAELALCHVRRTTSWLPQFFWFPLLCQASPNRGVATLLTMLAGLRVEPNGVAVAMIGHVFDDRASVVSGWRDGLTPEQRLALVKDIHRHVDSKHDAVHAGAYSPGNREHAEDGRRAVFAELMDAQGPLALEAKLELATVPAFAHVRDRIAMMARERLAAEVDQITFGPVEVARMLEGKELAPTTTSDMAKLLSDRLDDLQELMLRDTAPRAAWAMVNDENSLRPAIAREFEVGARGAYTVDQEAVTVDGKETDIRLRAPSGHQATIELKVGEKSRSAAELRDTIQNQLVLKYMAHKSARSGCLLVTVAKSGRTWRHPDDGRKIDKSELQKLLDEAALEAQSRLGGEARVFARVLDLTPRLTTEAKAKRRRQLTRRGTKQPTPVQPKRKPKA